MKALLLSEYKHLVLADLPVPSIEADEILVRVAACGICGSDVHGYDGSTGRQIPPIVMGHEAAGVVEAVGSKVSSVAIGDRVTFDSTISCGECGFCTAGEINLCDHRQVMGVSCAEFRRAGAFAEFVAVPARVVYRLPDELSFPEAAMLEAVSVALHAVRLSGIQAGETGLVIGAGMIGLLTLQAARAAGLSRVLVADVDRSRLELAKNCGADENSLAFRRRSDGGSMLANRRKRCGSCARSGGDRCDGICCHWECSPRRTCDPHRQCLTRSHTATAKSGQPPTAPPGFLRLIGRISPKRWK